jgi:hypothetical protein
LHLKTLNVVVVELAFRRVRLIVKQGVAVGFRAYVRFRND